jgi:serine phosphatase RsbU (regulator of sigma subunit)
VRKTGAGQNHVVIDELFEAAPVGLGSFDAQLRWASANEAMALLNRRPVDELLGRRPTEIHAVLGLKAEEMLRRVIATGEGERGTLSGHYLSEPDVLRFWDVAWFPLTDGVGVAAVEITERVRAEQELAEAHRHEALLARGGHLLSTALSVEETAETIVRLVVPELADWCFVELAREGRIDRVAFAHRDPSKTLAAREFDRRYPIDPAAPAGSAKVVRTGEPELIADISDEFLQQVAQDEEHLRLLRDIGFRSACVVPLVARGRILGDLAMATDGASGRLLRPDILGIAGALAGRAALALDNAALYAQRERVAVSLQEELLPPRLPSIPWLDVAARYSAAGEGNEVGGDFYDLFASSDGWQVVIGDVVGKGPAAAAVTGLARHTLRAAAVYEGTPSQLLRGLNRALLAERQGHRIASVACVRIDREGDGLKLTASVAGHPLPLIVGLDGRVRELGRFGQLLGVEDELVVFDTTDHLAPGELLLLYTDGVVEARGPGGLFGEEHLASLLGELAAQAPSRVLQRVQAAVLAASGGRPRDDVAMIALTARAAPSG